MTTPMPDPNATPEQPNRELAAAASGASPVVVDGALLATLAAQLGVSTEALLQAAGKAPDASPTLAQCVVKVLPIASPGQRHTYTPYLRRLAADELIARMLLKTVAYTELRAFLAPRRLPAPLAGAAATPATDGRRPRTPSGRCDGCSPSPRLNASVRTTRPASYASPPARGHRDTAWTPHSSVSSWT